MWSSCWGLRAQSGANKVEVSHFPPKFTCWGIQTKVPSITGLPSLKSMPPFPTSPRKLMAQILTSLATNWAIVCYFREFLFQQTRHRSFKTYHPIKFNFYCGLSVLGQKKSIPSTYGNFTQICYLQWKNNKLSTNGLHFHFIDILRQGKMYILIQRNYSNNQSIN